MTTQPYQAGADPDAVHKLEDLAGCLKALRIHAGNKSYRELERWVTEQRASGRPDLWLTRSSISEALTGKRLPTKEFVLTFVQACGLPADEHHRWTDAWARVAAAVQDSRQTKSSPVAATDPAPDNEPVADVAGPSGREPGPAEPAVTLFLKPAPPPAVPGPPVVRNISRLMQWLSGADPTILAACPRDRPRLVGLGGTVLTTATLATASVVFTAKVALGTSIWTALVIGLGWGLAIMNLDRWMVVISHRHERLWQNLTTVLPRLALSVLLGLTISTPVVLWIFNQEIESELVVMHAQDQSEFDTALRQDPRFAQIPVLENRVDEEEQIAYGAVNGQVTEARRAAAKADLAATNAELSQLRAAMNDEEKVRAVSNNAGLLARIEALGRLTSSNGSLSSAYFGLLTLLTLVDVLPVLVKFLMNVAPPTLYDRLVARADEADAGSMLASIAR